MPKALSTVFSRASLLTPRTVETAAPPDVDAMWLDRVSEFVPEDVVAVVEPRRPHTEDTGGTTAWLEAVRRVAEHGCAPKLRCGGPRASDVPDSAHVEEFVQVAVETGRPFTVLGLREVVHTARAGTASSTCCSPSRAPWRARTCAARWRPPTGRSSPPRSRRSPERAVKGVRGLVSRCGVDLDPLPTAQLSELGLLA